MSVVGKVVSSVFGGGSSDTPKYEDKASQVQMDMFNRSLKEMKPYSDMGKRFLPEFETAVKEGVPGWWQGKNYPEQIEGLGGRLGLDQINEDPIFQWRLKTMQDELNKSMAGEGKLYSSMAPERYAHVVNALTAEEADKAYSRQFSELSTLQGMGQQEQEAQYRKMLDLLKVGTGAASQAGQYAQQTGQNLGGLYANLAGTSAMERGQTQDIMGGLLGTGAGLFAGMKGWLG